ncbi:MAG: shikimate kinase [Gammaproteobacteria bacterium]|nr:shikimate kinase [Gammaproteobacteria bacterium]
MMGAGKTTVGRRLSRSIGWQFVDLDQHIEDVTGVSVATIFEIEGESGFRQREALALQQLASVRNMVVATGGGVVLNPMNRTRMAATGIVVYLRAAPELLNERTRHDKSRPLLQVANPLARISSLVEKRDPLYREVADIIIESSAGLSSALLIELTALLNLALAASGESSGPNQQSGREARPALSGSGGHHH